MANGKILSPDEVVGLARSLFATGDTSFQRLKQNNWLRVKSGQPKIEIVIPTWAVPEVSQADKAWDEATKAFRPLAPGEKGRTLYHLPVAVVDRVAGAVMFSRIATLECGPGLWGPLADALAHETVGGRGQVYELRATGTGLQTRYPVTRIERCPDSVLAQIAALAPEFDPGDEHGSTEDIPF